MKYADLTPELERELVTRYQAGDREAGRVIVETFERLTLSAIVQRVGKIRRDLDDAVQDVRMFILEAARRFDLDRGNRFGSYVSKFAFGRFVMSTSRDSVIVVKSNADRDVREAEKIGREVSDRLRCHLRMRHVASLDAAISEEGDTWHDVVAGDLPHPDARIVQVDTDARRAFIVAHVLEVLSERERNIVQRYHMSEKQPTLREIAPDFGVTYERVRQILEKAMPKMQRAVRAVATEDDRSLWGGKSAPPTAAVRAPKRSDTWLDEYALIVLRALRRAGFATAPDLSAASRGQVGKEKTYRALDAAEKAGVVQSRVQTGSTAHATRHYWLTDHGRAVLDAVARAGRPEAA